MSSRVGKLARAKAIKSGKAKRRTPKPAGVPHRIAVGKYQGLPTKVYRRQQERDDLSTADKRCKHCRGTGRPLDRLVSITRVDEKTVKEEWERMVCHCVGYHQWYIDAQKRKEAENAKTRS